jgi:hypothetical protein
MADSFGYAVVVIITAVLMDHAHWQVVAASWCLMALVAALWESGAKRPSGMALKLLAVVDKHGLKALT